MREAPHSKLLCMLIYGTLTRSSARVFSGMPTELVKDSIEALSEEILVFFSEADSYHREWHLPIPEEEEAFEKGVFKFTYDSEETEAADRAERGDFRALEEMILERGYLRTSVARELAVDRMRGIKKRGSPSTAVNYETFLQVATIQFREGCNEYKAKKIWLESNPDTLEETLSSRLKRAKESKKSEAIRLFLSLFHKTRVHNSRNPEP